MNASLGWDWTPAGKIELDVGGKLRFPALTSYPGIYRIRFSESGQWCVYVGEADNLRRRSGNYRNPGPSQQTSLRINRRLTAAAQTGSLEVQLLTNPRMEIDGRRIEPDFRRKAFRVLFEQAALVAAIEEGADVIVNL